MREAGWKISARPEGRAYEVGGARQGRAYFSAVYSALAWTSSGRSASASFQVANTSWYVRRALAVSPALACARASHTCATGPRTEGALTSRTAVGPLECRDRLGGSTQPEQCPPAQQRQLPVAPLQVRGVGQRIERRLVSAAARCRDASVAGIHTGANVESVRNFLRRLPNSSAAARGSPARNSTDGTTHGAFSSAPATRRARSADRFAAANAPSEDSSPPNPASPSDSGPGDRPAPSAGRALPRVRQLGGSCPGLTPPASPHLRAALALGRLHASHSSRACCIVASSPSRKPTE